MPLPKIGLYYPYIHFRDEAWLKAAALYWPKMGRIMPVGYPIRDSELVRVLADELDFILPISPNTAAASIAEPVGDLICTHAEEVRANFDIDTTSIITGDDIDPRWPMRDTSLGLASEDAEKLAGVHVDYMTPELRRRLVDLGMVVEVGPWLAMHPYLAWLYMCMLAQEVADNNSLLPATDQFAAQAAGSGWNVNRIDLPALLGIDDSPLQQPGQLANVLGLLAVRLAVPAGLADVPAARIVRIRQRHADEFNAFSVALSEATDSLAGHLNNIQDAGVATAYVEQVVKQHFERPLRELEAVLRSQRLDVAFAVANVKVELPAVTLAAGSLLGQPVVASAAAAGVGLLQVIRATRERRVELLKPTAASYLLDVGVQASNPDPIAGVLHRLSRRVNRKAL